MKTNLPIVKIVTKTGNIARQLPSASPEWDGFYFELDRNAGKYDYFVAYDDLPAKRGERYSRATEILACPRANTVLVTHEPSVVKIHGSDFVAQFAAVLTCHERYALQHKNKIAAQPASPWWYSHKYSLDDLRGITSMKKTKLFSTVCSNKQQKHTLHLRRWNFTRALQKRIPEMEVFGHGVRPFQDKLSVIDDYRYHLVVENHLCPHYWTEKLADAFLGFCLPFYIGAPDAADYFPPLSFIPLNIDDIEGSVNTILAAIENNEYEKRLPHIVEARRRVLEEHNLYALVTRTLRTLPAAQSGALSGETFYSRRALMMSNPVAAFRYFTEKAAMQGFARIFQW